MRFMLYFVTGLAFLSIILLAYFAVKKDTQKAKRSGISFILFAVFTGALFFAIQKTGVHYVSLQSKPMKFSGAILSPEKAVVDKDTRSISLIMEYRNTDSKDGEPESIDNKNISISVMQGSNNITHDLDKADIYSPIKVGGSEKIKLTMPTGNFKTDMVWDFKQANKSETLTINLK